MLSDDPRRVRRACLVTSDGVTPEHPAFRDLVHSGWHVHILACGASAPPSADTTDIAAVELPSDAQVREFHGAGPAERSDTVRHALERLHREHRFELIAFSGCGGLGARAIQAKRAGLAFGDTALAVYLDGNSQRDREADRRWPSCFAEVETDFLERFAFESADVQCVPDDALAEFAKRNHWNVWVDAVQSVADLPQLVGEARPASNLSPQPPPPGGEGEKDLRSSRALEEPNRSLAPPLPPGEGAGGRGSSANPLVTVAIAHHNLGAYFPDTLATLAAQTHTNFELIAIDDGSTDAGSVAVFESMRAKYPRWQFHRQTNAGIGATRNRCLELARGEFFVPVDADNLACPDMLAKFVSAVRRNPDLAAMSCYFLAFDVDAPNLKPDRFLYALRPACGPHALASIRNVYGDANAIFRTAALRSVGGYEIDRGTSCEDWECFVKLVHAGHRLGVVPDHLFYYRHRPGGFSRSTNWFANHQRVLRQFARAGARPPAESLALWTALLGFHQELEHREKAAAPRRHRLADRMYSVLGWFVGRGRAVRSTSEVRRP